MRKYLRIFLYAARDQLSYLPAFLARSALFAMIIFVFFSLWRAIYSGAGTMAGLTLVQTLWYLTFTESIEFSKTRLLNQIQEEVRDGTLAVTLSRPYSYVLFHLCWAMGESCVKIVPFLTAGFLLATVFVGPLPGYFSALPLGLILILCGLFIANLWLLAIGLMAFWMEEVSPLYWIIQKMVFILGGLFLPLNLLPSWLSGISRILPFAFSAYWPAYSMVAGSSTVFLTGLAGAIVYIALLFGISLLLYGRGRRKVHAQGG